MDAVTTNQQKQMVMGPAGTGKSTYCKVIQEHCQNVRRSVHVVNLDPAAESFEYDVAFDIRGEGAFVGQRSLCCVTLIFVPVAEYTHQFKTSLPVLSIILKRVR